MYPLLWSLTTFLIVLPLYGQDARQPQPLVRLAMGSCNRQDLPNALWDAIDKRQPDTYMWMGDNIYGDTQDASVLEAKYNVQWNNPGYKKIRQKYPIIGTWDDHDYGQNDVGSEYPIKEISQKLFLDFIGEPLNSPRRNQKGIFTSYDFGPKNQKVKIILLDTRYHRDPLGSKNADLLGETQWKWLENELQTSDAQINVIVSSISVLSRRIIFTSGWVNYPKARERLTKVLERSPASGILFLTGDRHFTGFIYSSLGRQPYAEFMSSGMTHISKRPARDLMRRIYGKDNSYFEKSFALMEIDWSKSPTQVHLNGINKNNKVGFAKSLLLDGKTFRVVSKQ